MEPQPQDACLGLQVAHEGLGIWIRRVDEQSHNGRRWDQLVQQLRSLEPQFPAQRDHAREIAACKAALKKSRRSATKVPFNGEVTRQRIAAALMTKVKAERAIADTPKAEVLKEAIFVAVRACAPKMISRLKK